MELNFTGRGAMLNPSEGNTSAYFEDAENFYLIDCGEDVASKLISMGKLNQDKNYYVFITHTHSDHIGSIGTLQQYLYWVRGKKIKVVVGNAMLYTKDILSILNSFGITSETYEVVDITSLDNQSPLFNSIRYRESSHGATPLKSASIIINTKDGNILYTGDIADSKVISDFINENTYGSIDKMYIDTSLQKSPVHLSLEELRRIVPATLNEKVYCMHLSSKELIPEIKKCGFNIVETDRSNLLNRDINSLNDYELYELEQILRGKLNDIESHKNSSKFKTYQKTRESKQPN